MAESHTTPTVRVAADGMAVVVLRLPSEATLEASVERLHGILTTLKIAEMPSLDELTRMFRDRVDAGHGTENVVIREGTRPQDSQDGQIEWAQDFFSTEFEIDPETGNVDYRSRLAKPSVVAGQLLARMIPPVHGTPGRDVFGRVLPAREPSEVSLVAANNVRFASEEGAFYAQQNGRVRRHLGVLYVDDMYVIHGDVGLRTGHITHPGFLRVRGDILRDSRVKVDGDIFVEGRIEPAHIECGGNIMVQGGILGDEGYCIRADGGVQAQYIGNSLIEAGDTVCVNKEIRNSIIRTRGGLVAKRARIVGGEAIALKGIDVMQAGSEGAIPSKFYPGKDFRLEPELIRREQAIALHEANIAKTQPVLDALLPKLDSLPSEQRAAVHALVANRQVLEKNIAALRDEIETLKEESQALAVPRMLIRERAFPEASIYIEFVSLRLREDVLGPVRALLSKGEVQLVSATMY